MISESDWKKFKKIKEVALERFCSVAVADYTEAVTDSKLSSHGKHLYLYRLAINYEKRIGLLFDDHSRSKAVIQLLLLRDEKLVTDEELAPLSDELKAATKPKSAVARTRATK